LLLKITLESTSESKNESTATDLTYFSTNKISTEELSTRVTFYLSTKLETNQVKDVTTDWNDPGNVTNNLTNSNNTILMETKATDFSTTNETSNLPSESNTNSATVGHTDMIKLTSVLDKATITDLSVEKTTELNSGNFSDSTTAVVKNLTDESLTSHSSTFESSIEASEKYETSILNSFESSSNQIKTTPASLLFELSTIIDDSNTSETFFRTFIF
jgi:hypothetical protein